MKECCKLTHWEFGVKMLSKCKKIVYSLTLIVDIDIANCWDWSVNKNFVVSLKTKVLTARKFRFASFTNNCLKWSTNKQSWSAKRQSYTTRLLIRTMISHVFHKVTSYIHLSSIQYTAAFSLLKIYFRCVHKIFC